MDFLVIFLLILAMFSLYFLGMGIRMLLRKGAFRAGCSSEVHISHDNVLECGVCPKKEINLCESRDDMGLAGISSIATMGRFDKDTDESVNSRKHSS
jgi:hypothetical protein